MFSTCILAWQYPSHLAASSDLHSVAYLYSVCLKSHLSIECFSSLDCSQLDMVLSRLDISQHPSNLDAGDNATLSCQVSSVSRRTTLMWTVDNVTYNTSGTFNTSRGQIVLSYSAFDSVVTCSLSSNLTILNVSMDSEGIYTCTAISNNSTTKRNVSLMLSRSNQTATSSGEF